MTNIKEYALFYLRFEHFGKLEDLKALGIKDASIDSEMALYKWFIDELSQMVQKWDVELKRNLSYYTGVGEKGVITQHCGPVFLAYVPIINKESTKSLYALMAMSLPRVLRKMGMRLRYVRGAFLQGIGWEIGEGDCKTLYGPIMWQALHTLTELAYSPRIIVGQDVFKIVGDRNSYGPGVDGDWLPLYTKIDYDGQAIFHYLAYDLDSPAVKSDTVEVVAEEIRRLCKGIRYIILRMAEQYPKYDCSGSIRNLLALQDYFQESAQEWTNRS